MIELLKEKADIIWEFRGQIVFGAIIGAVLVMLVGCVL